MANDELYKRFLFVRYADDFIIGVIGSKKDCITIREDLKCFLDEELGLTLSIDKTKITNAREEQANFLGTSIRITPIELRPYVTATRGETTMKMRPGTRPQLLAPISSLVKRLEDRGLARHGGNPTRFGHMVPFDVDQIVRHMFSIWRGYAQYYSFVDNYGSLGRIHYIIKYSCILTLAAKLKLKTKAAVFRKFGTDINIIRNDKIVAFFPNVPLANTGIFNNKAIDPNKRLEKLSRATFRSCSVLDRPCTICQSTDNVEMHHVRAIRKTSEKIKHDYFTAMMSRMNRKQIPVCRDCHIKIHGGNKNLEV
jgi:hypothetical protein